MGGFVGNLKVLSEIQKACPPPPTGKSEFPPLRLGIFYIHLRIINLYFTTYTHSPKVFNKNNELHSKINHRQFYCFSFITCKVGILSAQLEAKCFTLAYKLVIYCIVTFENYQPSPKQNAYRQFQVNRFKACQHLQTTINKSNGIFFIEIIENKNSINNCQLTIVTDLIRNIFKGCDFLALLT